MLEWRSLSIRRRIAVDGRLPFRQRLVILQHDKCGGELNVPFRDTDFLSRSEVPRLDLLDDGDVEVAEHVGDFFAHPNVACLLVVREGGFESGSGGYDNARRAGFEEHFE